MFWDLYSPTSGFLGWWFTVWGSWSVAILQRSPVTAQSGNWYMPFTPCCCLHWLDLWRTKWFIYWYSFVCCILLWKFFNVDQCSLICCPFPTHTGISDQCFLVAYSSLFFFNYIYFYKILMYTLCNRFMFMKIFKGGCSEFCFINLWLI